PCPAAASTRIRRAAGRSYGSVTASGRRRSPRRIVGWGSSCLRDKTCVRKSPPQGARRTRSISPERLSLRVHCVLRGEYCELVPRHHPEEQPPQLERTRVLLYQVAQVPGTISRLHSDVAGEVIRAVNVEIHIVA